jgi:hypothetical protein
MSTPVLTIMPKFPVKHWLTREFITHTFGDGWSQMVSSEVGYNRADGAGNQTSYKGLNHFSLHYARLLFGAPANNHWIFFRTRLDNNNEPFYFYNPPENFTPDPTGNNATGRYLVKIADPNKLSRTLVQGCLFDYDDIEIIETRS